jgi:hypothetical protein
MEQFESTDDERRNRKATDALRRMSSSQSKFRVSGFWARKSYRNAIRVAVTATSATSPMNRSNTTASSARFLVRRFLQQVITLDDVAAGASGRNWL